MMKFIAKLSEVFGLYVQPVLSTYTIGYGLLGLYAYYKMPDDHSSAISEYVVGVTSFVIPVGCVFIGVFYALCWYFDNFKKYRERKRKAKRQSNW
ncbi:hypothetical protein ACJPR0_004212 [Cronobacter sakazakii]|nr:hypothetical protein [Cronobacter dublinensis]